MVTIAVTTIITVTVIFKTVHSKLAKKESLPILFIGSHLPYLSEPKFPMRERSKADRKLLKNGLRGLVGKHVPLLPGLCKLSDTFGQS